MLLIWPYFFVMSLEQVNSWFREDELEQVPQSLLPDDFVVPDLSFPETGPDYAEKSVRFVLRYNGMEIPSTVCFIRNDYRKFEVRLTSDAFTFSGHFVGQNWPYFFGFQRYVEPSYRDNGLGTACMEIWESLVRRMMENYPEERVDLFKMRTKISAVVSMVIDQEWLVEKGLVEFCHVDGRNLGYRPVPEDEEKTVALIRFSNNRELADNIRIPYDYEVVLIKPFER